MAESLLAGVRVVDLAGEPAAMTGRILGDLGAEVVRVAPPLDGAREVAWAAGKVAATPDELPALLAGADIVIATPGWPGTVDADRALAPQAVWVDVSPFGLSGPRAHWRASDLGVMASSGNMYATGDRDRAPVRCSEPSGYSHTGPEAALAALTALASGRPQHVDVSMQETVLIANMGSVGRCFRAPARGSRSGASVGRSREIWPCRDGFVSFGLRGGKARIPNLQTMTRLLEEAGMSTPAWSARDWSTYHHNDITDDELRELEAPLEQYFAERTMGELYEVACETHLMLAPANSPRELYGSAQLDSRGFFGPFEGVEGFPLSFVQARSVDGEVAPVRPTSRAAAPAPAWPARPRRDGDTPAAGTGAWTGTRILEFGSGAAGPIATRFFAEHGATVVRVESRSRPDFLRVYALGPGNPHGLEGSELFDALNVGKLSMTLNMKHPRGVELAKRLAFEWADAVAENFAPKAMRGFGMDYDTLAAEKPDLVMVSACLQGNTGPHRNYPGFGGQGSALSGFNFLTGWPDREPLGPHGTITDSLAPRFSAAALAAGLLYRRRTGRGVYLDLAQVEAAAWSLSPWLLEFHLHGRTISRAGNACDRAVLHGAYPCAGDDRWVAIAAWTADEAEKLAKVVGVERITEEALAAWTAARSPLDVATTLQATGVEAVPVADFVDVYGDPQLEARGHFVALTHPFLGEGRYERNGFRLSDAPSGYPSPSPTLGEHTATVLGDILGLSADEQRALAEDGVLD